MKIGSIPRPLTVLLLFSLVAVAVYAAVTLGPFTVNLTVGEPLSVSPGAVDAFLFAGESASYAFTISNLASVTIDVTIVASVTAFPSGGSAADVTLTYPATVPADAGDTLFGLGIAVDQGAVAGTYTIEVAVTR